MPQMSPLNWPLSFLVTLTAILVIINVMPKIKTQNQKFSSLKTQKNKMKW